MSLSLLLLAGALSARADVAPADRWLATGHVAVGLAADGSLGNAEAGVGVLFDPDGPDGAFPLGGDAVLPGRDFEAWGMEAADVGGSGGAAWTMGAPELGSDLVLTWDAPVDGGALTWIHGAGGDDAVTVDLWVVLPWGAPVAWFVVDVTAAQDLSGLAVAKSYDPDIDHWATGAYETRNEAGADYALAEGDWDGRAWALVAADGVGGVCEWCALPSEIAAGADSSDGDDQLGVAVEVGDLAAGERVRVLFAYAFGPDGDTALAEGEAAAWTDDLDGDGVGWEEDCDDLDPTVLPGGAERADNGVDDDCDGEVDEAGAGDTGAGDTGADRDDWDVPYEDGGGIDEIESTRGGGCALAPAAPAAGLLLLLLPLWSRREVIR